MNKICTLLAALTILLLFTTVYSNKITAIITPDFLLAPSFQTKEEQIVLVGKIATELFQKGNIDRIDEFFAEDFIGYSWDASLSDQPDQYDRETLKKALQELSLTQIHFKPNLQEVLFARDKMILTWSCRVNNYGIPIQENSPPKEHGCCVYTIQEGKIKNCSSRNRSFNGMDREKSHREADGF